MPLSLGTHAHRDKRANIPTEELRDFVAASSMAVSVAVIRTHGPDGSFPCDHDGPRTGLAVDSGPWQSRQSGVPDRLGDRARAYEAGRISQMLRLY